MPKTRGEEYSAKVTPHTLVATRCATPHAQRALLGSTECSALRRATTTVQPTLPKPCAVCAPPGVILWQGRGWRLTPGGPTGLPFSACLAPIPHLRSGEVLGSLRAELEHALRVIKDKLVADPEISGVEARDTGPRADHLRIFVLARPAVEHPGQASNLAFLSDLLPPTDPAVLEERGAHLALALDSAPGALEGSARRKFSLRRPATGRGSHR